jgi:hypothetical protein
MTAFFTVAGQADIRQRLNADGLASLGLAGPLLSPAWTQTQPANVNTPPLRFTIATVDQWWYAPLAGMLVPVANGTQLGLSALDGTPAVPASAVPGGAACAVLRIHPQARLRLERAMVQALQPAGAQPPDRSLRPVPSTILIRNLNAPLALAQQVAAGELAMPAGEVSYYDEHGLIIDPFAFAAAVAAILTATPALGAPMPSGGPAGTPATIAGQVAGGTYVHVVDPHGRPWTDPPGNSRGISFYTGQAGSRTEGTHVTGGTVQVWPTAPGTAAVLGGQADPDGTMTTVDRVRFGFSTIGTLTPGPLSWPAAGPQTPVRDTLRVTAVDPVFHLLGNRTAADREGVVRADAMTVDEAAPQVRQGSPVTPLADGRSVLGWFNQQLIGVGGAPTGPVFASSVTYDGDNGDTSAASWPLPTAPGTAGQWPIAPAAVPVNDTVTPVLSQLAPLRTNTTVNWVTNSNDVLVTLPVPPAPVLPAGVAIRLYPIRILLGTSPDEQPLLQRADGAATITTGGAADTILLTDPFRLGPTPVRDPATLRVDAIVTWVSATAGLPPQVKVIANLMWQVGAAEVQRPAPGPTNLLTGGFWRGSARNPMLGAPGRKSFTFADPIGSVQSIVRQLTTDQNPREAPRLPTMSRTESILSMQMPASSTDMYRSVLTGGWLTRETDTHSHRMANPGAVGAHEVHAPGVAVSSQLGFDLWVAAAHRARPVVPTQDIATLPGLPNNWVLLQATSTSAPPSPPSAPTTTAGAVLQTVPAFVETPELALIPHDNVDDVTDWVTDRLGDTWVSIPNKPEVQRQLVREVRSAKYGRRDAQWALLRAISHARELVYIETPLFGATSHVDGAPTDSQAAVDLVAALASRLAAEPRLRVVILVPREIPFTDAYAPWSMYFHAARTAAAQTLKGAGNTVDSPSGPRPRVVIAHPMGAPGRPLVIRTTTVVVDDVWCLSGTSSWSRRGLTFDGGTDLVLADWQLDRGAGASIRAHRKALMAAHLGVGPGTTGVGGGAPPSNVGAPTADWVRLHEPVSAHEAFADVLAAGGQGKLLPLWAGPDPAPPGAVQAHPTGVADPDGRDGASILGTIAAALGGNGAV